MNSGLRGRILIERERRKRGGYTSSFNLGLRRRKLKEREKDKMKKK